MHNNSFLNNERALFERVLSVSRGGRQQPPPQPQPGFVVPEMRRFTKRLLHAVRRVPPMSTEEFVDSYVGSKRAMYARVASDLEVRPLTRSDSYVMAFIKDEKTNLTRKEDPCPRIIQPRSPRFNVEIGIHLKPMEKPIFRAIGAIFGGVTVMKGLNAQQRGEQVWRKWNRFNRPYAIMLDASRFDQHCSAEIIRWEHSVEEAIALDRERLKKLNRMRFPNKCFIRTNEGGYKYTLNGVRMSGDMDTALCNCLTMCAMTYSFMTHIGVGKYEYMNDGDDGVLMVEWTDRNLVLDNFRDYFLRFGFTMKLEGETDVLEQIDFCQARPVFDGTSYRFVRDPRICLDKDSISLRGLTDCQSLRELRNSVGWCGLSLAGDMPIFGEYYHSMLDGVEPPRKYSTGMEYLAKGMNPKYVPPTDECRISFYHAYDITPDQQLDIEHTIKYFSSVIDSPATPVMRVTNYNQLLSF